MSLEYIVKCKLIDGFEAMTYQHLKYVFSLGNFNTFQVTLCAILIIKFAYMPEMLLSYLVGTFSIGSEDKYFSGHVSRNSKPCLNFKSCAQR